MFRYDTTDPVRAYVIERLKKNSMMLPLQLNEKDLKKALKKNFKASIDPFLFRHAKWKLIAQDVNKLLKDDEL